MSDVRQQYLKALVEYSGSGCQKDSAGLSKLVSMVSKLPPGGLVALHHDCLQRLTANVEPEDTLSFYARSESFLQQLFPGGKAQDGHPAMAAERNPIDHPEGAALSMKAKYENILQHMDSGILLFDEAGFLTFINVRMSRMLGLPRTALLGHNLYEIALIRAIPKSMRKRIVHLYRDMIRYRVPYHEVTDESGCHLLVTATYGDKMDGDLLISVKDITEFKRIEQSAYQNDKLAVLGRISAAIAHEIRNPLTSIRGFFQLLLPELAKLGKANYAQIILEEIDRANDIIFEFLNSSKPTAPDKRTIPVGELLKEVAMLFESEALMENCLIETSFPSTSLEVWVDEKQIKQVMLNLVKNALEAVSGRKEKQGVVRLWAEQEGSFAHLYVQDNGNGMDQGTLSRLFDPFFTTKQEGCGLGLSVSYRIIKNHGGRIDVRSKVGEGTTFLVALPIT